MTHDVGRHGLAQRYLIQALHLADAAGDRALASEILAAMSQQATGQERSSAARPIHVCGRQRTLQALLPSWFMLYLADGNL